MIALYELVVAGGEEEEEEGCGGSDSIHRFWAVRLGNECGFSLYVNMIHSL
jgi:hypothetical protein